MANFQISTDEMRQPFVSAHIKGGSKSGRKKQGKSSKRKSPKKSAAQLLLDPTDILSPAHGATVEERWNWFSDRLSRAGFDGCGFLISRNDIESPLGNPESRLYGDVVSPEYLQAVVKNPEMQTQARPYRMLRTSRSPVTYFGEEDIKLATPSERKLAAEVNEEYGIEGWALCPVHAPERNRIYGLGWWDLENQANAKKFWEAESGTLSLATTYFAESIAAIINPDDAFESHAKLSQREIECLLWAGAGRTTSEIAGILNVADGTIDEYFKRAAKKLGASTRAQACVKAVLSGIITP